MGAPSLEAELVKRARDAQGRDWCAAAEAAAELRRSFPGLRVGYEIGAAALRALRRFDGATAVLAEAEALFSEQPWLLVERASIAHAAGDFAAAQRLAAEARTRFPDHGAAYRLELSAARSLRRFDEASAIAAEAAGRFEDQAWPLVEQAWNAHACGNAEAASLMAAELRERFPENGGGYQIGSRAARSLRRFDEAESILELAAARFPNAPWVVVERASIAQERGAWDRARELAAELRRRFPENPAGYRIGVASARAMRNFEEADAAARDGVATFPNEAWPLSLLATNAIARGDYDEALRVAEALRAEHPAEEDGYKLGVGWLRNQNRLEEARAVLQNAPPRFSSRPWFARNAIELPNLMDNRADAARSIETLRGAALEKPSASDRVVVVLGMHRGGTSLCAKIVGRLRFSLGGPLLQAGLYNPDGYYEHAEINRLHEALLTRLGATWDTAWSVREPFDAHLLGAEANDIVGQLKALVCEQLRANGGRWAFKDPRTSWLMPIWVRLFDELGVTPIWLLAIRDPRAVAASLHARNRLPLELGELLWVEHYLNALRHLGPQIAAVIHYENWFSSPRQQIEKVAQALDASSAEVTEIVENSVIGNLRHNMPDSGEPLLGVTREVYGWLRARDIDLRKLQREAKASWRALEAIGIARERA